MIRKEFIRNELRYRYPTLEDSIRAPQQAVGRPLLFEGGTRKVGARIVVCSKYELDTLTVEEDREPLFLCIGSPKKDALARFDVCILPESERAGAVLNFVQRLFDRLDEWTQRLREAAETGEERGGAAAACIRDASKPRFGARRTRPYPRAVRSS